MKLPSARCVSLGGLTALLACSTPISFEPQIDDEEEDPSLDAGPALRDSGPDGRADASADASAADAATPVRDAGFACDVYNRASNCPPTAPASNAACTTSSANGVCFYPASASTSLVAASCLPRTPATLWSLTNAVCSYRCDDQLPQGNNFFSLLTDDCTRRPITKCQRADVHTSQQSVDRMLSEAKQACAVANEIALGITFTQQGCPDWLYYTAGRRLPNRQTACLSERLEALRVDCAPRCALSNGGM